MIDDFFNWESGVKGNSKYRGVCGSSNHLVLRNQEII